MDVNGNGAFNQSPRFISNGNSDFRTLNVADLDNDGDLDVLGEFNYKAKNLEGVALRNNDLTEWNFEGQNLTNANFEDSQLARANFAEAIITGADFEDTTALGFTKLGEIAGMMFEKDQSC